jgi:TRAP-type C4-dicarboxylate transport system permease small subunit
MRRFDSTLSSASRILSVVAGAALLFLMALTVLDVALRGLRHPIVGTYELVGYAGALVIGFSLPLAAKSRSHIYVDVLVARLPRVARDSIAVLTRLLVLALFVIIGWNLVKYGLDLRRNGEVSLTLQIPFYPFAFGLALCSFVQCLVSVGEIVSIAGGQRE